MSEALYGIAFCNYKLNNYQSAIETINCAIKLETINNSKVKNYKYLKAVCYKELDKLEDAEKYYIEVAKDLVAKEKEEEIKYLLYGDCYEIGRASCRERVYVLV